MGFRMNYLFIVCLLAAIYRSNGCTMEGVTTWQLPINVRIEDYFEGIVLQRGLTDIGGFNLISTSDLNGGPYIVAAIENSAFVLRTNEAYRLYEENETVDTISLTYAFTCTNGQTPSSPLTISIEINDNNNNIPMFKTPDDITGSLDTTYEFTIATPVPPGFTITNCVSDIIVRDIDLTTYRIDFGIEDNPYIAIEYDEADSTVAKEFKALLRSTTFIRSIPEPIILTISATDVDLTGDPSITTTTTVTIHGSSEFEMPLEPVFSQAFYLASYTEDNEVTMEQTISLQQGYDDLVEFNLEGDYADAHFAITANGNQVTLSVTSPLPTTALQAGQIHLVVKAAREFTSGASATIIVQLPEEVHLEFEQPHYTGQIVDNTLQLTQLILSQGYQGADVTASIEDHSQFFTATVTGNIITLSMTALDDNIIQENNVINLRVHASTDSSSATTIVTLEIVKDDVATPVFDQPLYTGTYNPATGLTVDSFVLVQGYDETVDVSLSGEYASYFELVRDGPSSTLHVTSLPSDILAESHALLSVTATKPRTVGASTVVSIALPGAREMQFESPSYRGSIQDNVLTLDPLVLSVGYDDDVSYLLSGDHSALFGLRSVQNQVEIFLVGPLPQEIVSANNFLMLTVTAEGLFALRTTTAVLLEIIKTDATTPVFSQTIYYGTHSASGVDIGSINLSQGYDNSVSFRIQGENSEYFSITTNQNSVTLNVQSSIPEDIIFQEKAFVFNIFADKPLTVGANAAIVIKFTEDLTESTVMQFGRNTYVGSLENNELTLESIVLETGYAVGTEFLLYGDFSASFTPTVTNNIVTLSLTSLPAGVSENNKFIVLELEARRDRAVPVVTGIILDLVREDIEIAVFNQAYYSGIYTEENTMLFQDTISLTQGFDETVTFGLEGESSAWFAVAQNGNAATVVSTSVLPPEVLESHHQLLFTVVAYKSNSFNGHAAITIELPKNILEQEVLRFTQSSYEGQLDGSVLQVPTITLSNELTDNVEVSHAGAYAAYFTVTRDSNTIHVGLLTELPSEVIDNNDYIILDLTASKENAVSGYTALILNIVKDPIMVTPVFEEAFYTGEISEQSGLLFEHTIRLIQGFDESVLFSIDGDGAERFILTQTGQNSLSISVAQGGLEDLGNNGHFVFSVVANKAGSGSGHAAIVIYNADSGSETNEAFDKVLYEGTINLNFVQHETITITGYTEGSVEINGVYRELFSATVSGGTVLIGAASTLSLPDGVSHVALELNAGSASAVLILVVIESETPELPTVMFGSPSYVLRTVMSQTGLLGQVQATSSNGESIAYSLAISDVHLGERISINSDGEIHLSAPTNTGVYSFEVIATTTITQVQATASVQLTVEAAAFCGDDHALPPLIILDRDEEVPHMNLVVLDSESQAGCQFRITNRWPLDQDWLYVDDTGLHARTIDREDPRIAFMALSQVQVELVLECASDTQTRVKRSTVNPRLDWLGPYEYGSNKWILTDTILYNSRRSFVNLIVNDINDNYPIFVGQNNQPIVCGYPVPELEEIVLPRALVELKATDADVGENAALMFWSSSEVLAVAPTTGFVHVRDGASLSHDQQLTVSVTDLFGREDGLTATVTLMVKLLDTSHIAVVTVRNAFLDQEETILANISSAVGYEVKVLSSAVISDEPADSENARHKREVTTEGASLQLYVYGLIEREPVNIDQLTNDITESVLAGVDITSTISLEDYLEGRQIYGPGGRDTGLLVATIVLSVLLFILMLLIALWFFLKWRKARNYDQFSDATSLDSQTEHVETPPKVDSLRKPRLNIDELKRSERRLQEMLDAPVDEKAPKAQTSQAEPETVINMALTKTADIALPLVIQSIDKLKDDENSGEEDEFGERKQNGRRKSVVTFNENVEKIIHVEDIPDDNSSDVEIFKF